MEEEQGGVAAPASSCTFLVGLCIKVTENLVIKPAAQQDKPRTVDLPKVAQEAWEENSTEESIEKYQW